MSIVKDLLELTWVELQELDKEKTIFLVTLAPIEEHSHHLPLGTDIYEGEAWRRKLIEQLVTSMPDFNLISLPFFPIATAGAEGFYGNLYFKQSTLRAVTYELLENMVRWGGKHLVVIASHGDPLHLIAIEEACEKLNRKYGVVALSPMGAFFSAEQLNLKMKHENEVQRMLENYPNDFHAGWIETSSMLDIDQSLVKQNYVSLPDTKIEARQMISAQQILKTMDRFGHLGYPRLGSQALGRVLNEGVSRWLSEVIIAFVKRENYQQYEHHFLYRLPFLRTNFLQKMIWSSLLVLVSILFWACFNLLK